MQLDRNRNVLPVVLMTTLLVAIVIVAVTIAHYSVAYHEWRMERTGLGPYGKAVVHSGPALPPAPDDIDERFATFEHHRDRLVELGAVVKLERTFEHVFSGTEDARLLIDSVRSRYPPCLDFTSPYPAVPRAAEHYDLVSP